MSTITRNLSFAEGVNVATPGQNGFEATRLPNFANDAAYVTAKASPAAEGDMYWNTTEKAVRRYNGTAWEYDKTFYAWNHDAVFTGSDAEYIPDVSHQITRFSSNTLISIRTIDPTKQKFLIICNDQATQALTLINQGAGGTAAYRIITGFGANVVIPPAGGAAILAYDEDTTRWRVITVSNQLLNPMTTLGDLMYGGALGVVTRLPGNTTNRRRFLRSQGSSSLATAPTQSDIQSCDISGLNAAQATAHTLTFASPTDVYISSPAGAINQDLPSTDVLAGQLFRLIVSGATTANTVTLRSSSGQNIDVINGTGYILVQALQNAPTASAHWKVIAVYDQGTIDGFLRDGGSTVPMTIRYARQNSKIDISMPQTTFGSTTSTSISISSQSGSNAWITSLTPGTTQLPPMRTRESTTDQFGYLALTNAGVMTVQKNAAAAAWTGSNVEKGILGGTFSYLLN